MKEIYTASVKTIGGRNGQSQSTDGNLNLTLKKPVEMGGDGGATNPEQLFAAAYGACYLGALSSIALRDNVDASKATANVDISFNQSGDSYFLSAAIEVHIPNITIDKTKEIADKAHIVCPYSKAVLGNMEVTIIAV